MALYSANWKLLSFEDGLMTLVDGLKKDLGKFSNVTIRYGEPITSLRYRKESDRVEVCVTSENSPWISSSLRALLAT